MLNIQQNRERASLCSAHSFRKTRVSQVINGASVHKPNSQCVVAKETLESLDLDRKNLKVTFFY